MGRAVRKQTKVMEQAKPTIEMDQSLPPEPQNPRAPSLRKVLQEKTDDIHQLLHRHSSFAALFKANLELPEYQRLVHRLFGFYAPLDDAVHTVMTAIGEGPINYGYVRRSDLLARDLLDLGLDQREIDITARCARIKDVVTTDTIGGALYVVEGATLGGSVIERALTKTLRTDGVNGRRYWSWCRAEGKYGWSKLNAYLDSVDANEQAVKNHVAGATGTFQTFAEWLEPLNRAHEPTLAISA